MRLVTWIASFAGSVILAGCGGRCGPDTASGSADDAYVVLDSVKVGSSPVEFYVAHGPDSAILGFSLMNKTGRRQYCPMYGSTYRGLPAVTLDVFVTHSQDEMWVRSSWSGHEDLAYHQIGANTCFTGYGEHALINTPMPKTMSGGSSGFPVMAAMRVTKAGTIVYAGR